MKKPVQEGRTAVFIDGANSYSTTRQLGFAIDYNELQKFIEDEFSTVLRFNYYTCVAEDDTQPQTIRPLLDWLAYNGYNVVTKKTKTFDNDGRLRIKNDIDVDIAIDMLLAAQHVHHIVLFSGDISLKRAIEEVQRMGVRVTIVSSIKTSPSSISDELRRLADEFIDYQEIRKDIADMTRQQVVAG